MADARRTSIDNAHRHRTPVVRIGVRESSIVIFILIFVVVPLDRPPRHTCRRTITPGGPGRFGGQRSEKVFEALKTSRVAGDIFWRRDARFPTSAAHIE